MATDWFVQRTVSPRPDGPRCGDLAYQLLAQWSREHSPESAPRRRRSQTFPMEVALYVRVSTCRPAQTPTIDPQLDRLHAHVAAHPD